ncbi:hypothetical protein BV22DRAFT_1122900 [Leucogyrophana mollusca]|uniref:Uncharacterized protein n=1 Tax=Leucogyrophana mollusca TaxID=85980 RepID=A0ACB8B336_9AGAM|nr:hypothetical protein BV22DRAFT_1122900 [Leucogyrophana mollusca]
MVPAKPKSYKRSPNHQPNHPSFISISPYLTTMQLAFTSIMALAVAVASVQALPAQEKREPIDLVFGYDIAKEESSVVDTVEKRAPIMYFIAKDESENAEGTTVEKRAPIMYFVAEGDSENAEASPKM